jgi:valyl-tRNA synthetase
VLDTWFSSWLWPFSTLGWENAECDTEDFRRFYPTSALVTAYDIIFFWVSRMIMAGLEFTGRAPFRDIFIHGLVRDKQGRKMSKSMGNGLDPVELVDEFGADAVKFTLAFLCAQGQDIPLDRETFKLGSKFANKVWNASRYILMNLEGRNLVENPKLLPIDTWIYSRLNNTAKTVSAAFLSYRYNDAAIAAYEYFWNDFCDWYVEATKLSLRASSGATDKEKDRAATVLLDALAESLRLLHPLLPFVTEEIYGFLPNTSGLLITAAYPEYDEKRNAPETEAQFAFLQDIIRSIRTLCSECAVPPEKKVTALIRVAEQGGFEKTLAENEALIKLLANIGELAIESAEAGGNRPKQAIGLAGTGFEAFVRIADAVDRGFLIRKFSKELDKDKQFIASLQNKLSNGNFLQHAPPELVAGEKQKLEESLERAGKIASYIRDMEVQ